VDLGVDRTLPLEDRLAQIEKYINTEVRRQFSGINNEIGRLRSEVENLHNLSETVAKQARADLRAEIDQLAARLDTTQALDLTWAIVGLFVTAGGILLSYWA
jgi:uncharacterized protein YicC (UPF0701 family)